MNALSDKIEDGVCDPKAGQYDRQTAQATSLEHGFFGIAHLISPSGAQYG